MANRLANALIWIRIGLVVLVLATTTLVLLPIQLVAIRFELPVRRRLPRWWHRVARRAIGVRVHLHGLPAKGRPLLLASNHVSWLDITVLGSVADVAYIAKSEVRNWPIFGLFARLQRSVFIERSDKRGTGRQISDVAQRLKAGEIVVLFAEGTTSDGNAVLDFKSSLFGAASATLPFAEEGVVLVQPVAIAYTRVHGMAMGRYHRTLAAWPGDVEMIPSLLGVLREGAIDVDVSFGAPVRFTEESRRKTVAREAETAVRRMMAARLRGR
ncbi:lyso-ornithine lipid O-acyltransferase [Pararhizobium mangrovi]|uniref:1-acyl-sn-glycerol-3-phosphate acyltransferase n=1 Tax=Pararhizobium mangrovi TaxID=2590452 RepID=A0A506U1T5_9HYPH|nr:1-acyl-sn-glycerol-3-phosphate acyltransferase [Pararhizobium mangrovi]TPW28332.1 1-acyl-sn-glycerol-3-phosphate acyltransferase [Pararhizobium mangrovi]